MFHISVVSVPSQFVEYNDNQLSKVCWIVVNGQIVIEDLLQLTSYFRHYNFITLFDIWSG